MSKRAARYGTVQARSRHGPNRHGTTRPTSLSDRTFTVLRALQEAQARPSVPFFGPGQPEKLWPKAVRTTHEII
jgi:hypothetical protein